MVSISKEAFDIIMAEILDEENPRFDALCHVTKEVAMPKITQMCKTDKYLRGTGCEDDIMQEVQIRIIKKVMYSFVKGKEFDADGQKYDKGPVGLQKWINRLATNLALEYIVRMKRTLAKNRGFAEGEMENLPGGDGDYSRYEDDMTVEALSRAFEIVLDSDVQVYKVLTWLAHGLFMISDEVKRIEAKDLIIQTFEEKSLYEMRDMLFAGANKIAWLKITQEHKAKINSALDAPYDSSRTYGQVTYKDFFMKKGGKGTISDWVNRMNSIVKRVMANETFNS